MSRSRRRTSNRSSFPSNHGSHYSFTSINSPELEEAQSLPLRIHTGKIVDAKGPWYNFSRRSSAAANDPRGPSRSSGKDYHLKSTTGWDTWWDSPQERDSRHGRPKETRRKHTSKSSDLLRASRKSHESTSKASGYGADRESISSNDPNRRLRDEDPNTQLRGRYSQSSSAPSSSARNSSSNVSSRTGSLMNSPGTSIASVKYSGGLPDYGSNSPRSSTSYDRTRDSTSSNSSSTTHHRGSLKLNWKFPLKRSVNLPRDTANDTSQSNYNNRHRGSPSSSNNNTPDSNGYSVRPLTHNSLPDYRRHDFLTVNQAKYLRDMQGEYSYGKPKDEIKRIFSRYNTRAIPRLENYRYRNGKLYATPDEAANSKTRSRQNNAIFSLDECHIKALLEGVTKSSIEGMLMPDSGRREKLKKARERELEKQATKFLKVVKSRGPDYVEPAAGNPF